MDEATHLLSQTLTAWIQTLGIVIAAATFVFSVFQNRHDRALERYEDIAGRWMDFFGTCREHPELDLGILSVEEGNGDEVRQRRVENAACLELLLLLERLFILDSIERSPANISPDALTEIVLSYAVRKNFVRVWNASRGWYDRDFAELVDKAISQSLSDENRRSRPIL